MWNEKGDWAHEGASSKGYTCISQIRLFTYARWAISRCSWTLSRQRKVKKEVVMTIFCPWWIRHIFRLLCCDALWKTSTIYPCCCLKRNYILVSPWMWYNTCTFSCTWLIMDLTLNAFCSQWLVLLFLSLSIMFTMTGFVISLFVDYVVFSIPLLTIRL